MPRDIDVIVRTLDTPDWAVLSPSQHRVTQEEVHDDARAEIARRGMAPETPYAGWHTQSSATVQDGMLTRPRRVSFGGASPPPARPCSVDRQAPSRPP